LIKFVKKILLKNKECSHGIEVAVTVKVYMIFRLLINVILFNSYLILKCLK